MRTIEGRYDLVIVDAAPQLNLVTINVLNAVGELIVPVDAGLYSLVGLGRLEETIGQVRRFLDNASHELRTPLTALKAELDLAQTRRRTEAERRSVRSRLWASSPRSSAWPWISMSWIWGLPLRVAAMASRSGKEIDLISALSVSK